MYAVHPSRRSMTIAAGAGPTDRLDTGTIKPNQQQQEVPKSTQARSIN